MTLTELIQQLKDSPEQVEFSHTMNVIDSLYEFTPAAFRNGEMFNARNENNGSCKLFAFARLQGLSVEETLHCFGSYYREDVLNDPQGTSHQNIRNFMQTGWSGIEYESAALKPG